MRSLCALASTDAIIGRGGHTPLTTMLHDPYEEQLAPLACGQRIRKMKLRNTLPPYGEKADRRKYERGFSPSVTQTIQATVNISSNSVPVYASLHSGFCNPLCKAAQRLRIAPRLRPHLVQRLDARLSQRVWNITPAVTVLSRLQGAAGMRFYGCRATVKASQKFNLLVPVTFVVIGSPHHIAASTGYPVCAGHHRCEPCGRDD